MLLIIAGQVGSLPSGQFWNCSICKNTLVEIN